MVMQNARCIFLHLRTRDVLFRSNEARHYTVSRRAATVHLCAPSISEITPVPRDETELLGQSFDLRSYRSPQFAGSVGSAESGAFRLEDVKTSVVDDQAGTLSLGGAGRRQQGRSRFHGPFQVGSGDLRQRMVARSGGGGAEQGGGGAHVHTFLWQCVICHLMKRKSHANSFCVNQPISFSGTFASTRVE